MKLTEKQKAVLLISSAYGIGIAKGRKLISAVNLEGITENLPKFRSIITSVLGEKDYREICVRASEINFREEEEKYTKAGVKIVTILDEEYPETLIRYEDAPLCLYCKGDIKLLGRPCFAVVGTRFPTKYGVRVTEEFVSGLSERFCIVSGLARGIDSCAHRTALESGGKTIAVLGCGIDVIYPPENRDLYNNIAEYGLVISEYPLGEGVSAHNFPARNRIISGLSRAVLITEAGEKSGTMLTLNYALNQGKDVFCVPGSIYNKASSGCNKAIKDCQTRLAVNINDIYSELGMSETDITKPSELQLDVNEDNIIKALTKNGEMHFEEILGVVDLSVPQLNSLLIKMTAVKLITKTKHNYWSI